MQSQMPCCSGDNFCPLRRGKKKAGATRASRIMNSVCAKTYDEAASVSLVSKTSDPAMKLVAHDGMNAYSQLPSKTHVYVLGGWFTHGAGNKGEHDKCHAEGQEARKQRLLGGLSELRCLEKMMQQG
jgi:hypothetical protein